MLDIGAFKQRIPAREHALPGRAQPLPLTDRHFVFGTSMTENPPHSEQAYFAMGCFWGVERLFWQQDGVLGTAVGYAGGYTPNPTYREVCSGQTGHAETVRVVYDPRKISYDDLLRLFWENHDPTQGMRQGNDTGTQYRSAIYTTTRAQQEAALRSRDAYQRALDAAHADRITTEIASAGPFYFAENEHQQYLAKNPDGYCGLAGTGVSCPIATGVRA